MRGLFLVLCGMALVACVVHPCSAVPCAGGTCCNSGILEVQASVIVVPPVVYHAAKASDAKLPGCVKRVAALPIRSLKAVSNAIREREHKPIAKVAKGVKLICHRVRCR